MRPKTPAARYYGERKKSALSAKIDIRVKKTKDPAPGSYNVEDCFRKTQWRTNAHSISKGKIKNYVDQEVKNKAFMPAVGRYKDLEKGYNALSKPPTSLKRRR